VFGCAQKHAYHSAGMHGPEVFASEDIPHLGALALSRDSSDIVHHGGDGFVQSRDFVLSVLEMDVCVDVGFSHTLDKEENTKSEAMRNALLANSRNCFASGLGAQGGFFMPVSHRAAATSKKPSHQR
jgi:hypothetical protein